MKKKNIIFEISIDGGKRIIQATGVQTFTLQGEIFIVHRSYVTDTFSKSFWAVSHFNTGMGTGVSEQTINETIQVFKDKVKSYKANIKSALYNKIQLNNKNKTFPCLKCQGLQLSMNSGLTNCENSETLPHKRKKICKQFKERSCIK